MVRRAPREETCLRGGKEGRKDGCDLFPQDVTMSEFLQNGPLSRAVCRSPSAQEAHHGCVAVQNGHSDRIERAAATENMPTA